MWLILQYQFMKLKEGIVDDHMKVPRLRDPPIFFCLSSGLPFSPFTLTCQQKCLTLAAIYVAHYFITDVTM
ncbi:unnamed protein product [Sphenostylis stenocarpa]|uniref:Uncharacterized protein n=1 Tax=Sphenostylis stenocarpa TaxID=92480 RepID=A0AA86RV94_9FABA|nr:unnamed protein product [Sphenostylis stenocarpa]